MRQCMYTLPLLQEKERFYFYLKKNKNFRLALVPEKQSKTINFMYSRVEQLILCMVVFSFV